MNISAILLAAGSSSRMGQSKQLLPIDNTTLLKHIVQTALASSVSNVLVVLGANASEHQNEIKGLPVTVIVNKDWKKGMGSSLKTGLQFLLNKENNTDAVIVLVCDQVMLTKAHLDSMLTTYQKSSKAIVASEYANTLGVPVLFDESLFDRILKLGDQQGAKVILNEFPESVSVVPFPDGEIDLDTPADYQVFLASKSETTSGTRK